MNKDFKSLDVRCNTYEYCTLATVTVPSIAPQTSGLKVFNRVLNSLIVSTQQNMSYRDKLLNFSWSRTWTISCAVCGVVCRPRAKFNVPMCGHQAPGPATTRTCRQIKINYSTIGLVHIAADNGELTPTLSWKYNAILQKFFVINDVSFSVCKMHVVLL